MLVAVVVSLLIDAPLPLAAAHVAVVPLDVKTKLLAPMASLVALLVPFPIIKSPVVVIGEIALNVALAVNALTVLSALN